LPRDSILAAKVALSMVVVGGVAYAIALGLDAIDASRILLR